MLSYIDFLQHHPEAYPHPTGEIGFLQTHISYLFLTGDYVYKIKKPVDFGFLDFTTIGKRKFCCDEEVRLNRRLSPDIYLGVMPVKARGEGFYLGGASGQTVEYAVQMVRMPEERMMNKVIAAGQFRPAVLAQIVEVLVPFFREAATSVEISRAGRPVVIGKNFRENLRQIEGFAGGAVLGREQFTAIVAYAEKFLTREDLFLQRMEGGRIRDGHGDLHSANICLADQVYIFDCIEFNPSLRYCDVASDVAFLAMDLDFHGLAQIANGFIDLFIARSGDSDLVNVLNFYKCYRACVRGKIGLLTGHAPEIDGATRATALEGASRYFKLAEQYGQSQ